MKKQTMLFALCAVVGVAVFAFADGKPAESPSADSELAHMGIQLRGEIAQLQTKVAELEAKNQSLENRVKGLESKVEELSHPHLMPLNSQSSIWTQPLQMPTIQVPLVVPEIQVPSTDQPKVWGEREINGWKFYVIPCGQKEVVQR
jgi:hypothetical protein